MSLRLKLTIRICMLFPPLVQSDDRSAGSLIWAPLLSLSTSRLPLAPLRLSGPVHQDRDRVFVELAYPRLDRRQRLGFVPTSNVHRASTHAASGAPDRRPSIHIRLVRTSTGKPMGPVKDFVRTSLVR